MKLIAYLLTFVLLCGCSAAETPSPAGLSEDAEFEEITPAPAPEQEENTQTPAPEKEDEPAPEADFQVFEYSFEFTNMSVTLPAGWSCKTVPAGSGSPCEPCDETVDDAEAQPEPYGEFGLVFWPEESPETYFTLMYKEMGFGVCGTELTEEIITLNSEKTAVVGTFHGFSHWSFVSFPDTPGTYVLEYWSAGDTRSNDTVWDTHQDQITEIVNSIRVGEGMKGRSEIVAIAAELCGKEPEARTDFDHYNGIWTVTFDAVVNPDLTETDPILVRLDVDGKPLDEIPESWHR